MVCSFSLSQGEGEPGDISTVGGLIRRDGLILILVVLVFVVARVGPFAAMLLLRAMGTLYAPGCPFGWSIWVVLLQRVDLASFL